MHERLRLRPVALHRPHGDTECRSGLLLGQTGEEATFNDTSAPLKEAGNLTASLDTLLDPASSERLSGLRFPDHIGALFGGALEKLLTVFRLGAGGKVGGGDQWLSWISLDDAVGLFAHAVLTPGLHGPLNAVAPMPVTGREYARALGKVLGRPALLPTPGFGPKLVLGSEGAELMALADQRVSADRAIDRGYRFRHPDLGSALREELGRF